MEVVRTVYRLLAQRDPDVLMDAYRLAAAAAERAEGPERLALFEAITHALDGVLTELAEHGAQAAVSPEVTPDGLGALVDAAAAACTEVRRMRDSGVTSKALIDIYVRDWMFPIGSRDWLGQMRAAVAHRSDPAWLTRVSAQLSAS